MRPTLHSPTSLLEFCLCSLPLFGGAFFVATRRILASRSEDTYILLPYQLNQTNSTRPDECHLGCFFESCLNGHQLHQSMDSVTISSLIGVLGTLLGSLITLLSQRDIRKISSMERKIDKLRREVIARQAQENVICQWLVELGQAKSVQSAQISLRNRAEQETGLRPSMSPSHLKT